MGNIAYIFNLMRKYVNFSPGKIVNHSHFFGEYFELKKMEIKGHGRDFGVRWNRRRVNPI